MYIGQSHTLSLAGVKTQDHFPGDTLSSVSHRDFRHAFHAVGTDGDMAGAGPVPAVADCVFHQRLEDEGGNLAVEIVLHIQLHNQLFFKPRLLQFQVTGHMVQLCVKAQHVLVVFQGLAVVGGEG